MMKPLTGIRAIAAFWVVLFHFNISPLNSLSLEARLPFLSHGYLGVDLFFILSGFVISHAHLNDFRSFDGSAALRFYALRLARFYPLHLVVLLGLLLIVGVGNVFGAPPASPEKFTPGLFFANLLLVQAWWQAMPSWNYPAWSVSCEWFAYLLFPVFALALNGLRDRRLVLPALGAAMALFVLAYVFVFRGRLNFLDDDHRPGLALLRIGLEFGLGGLLYRLHRVLGDARIPWSLLAVTCVAAGASLGGDMLDLSLVASFLFAIAAGAHDDTVIGRILARRPLVYLGEISYSLYMVHAPIQMTVGKIAARMLQNNQGLTAKGVMVGAGITALTVACAAVAYHLVEAPARTWLRARIPHAGRRSAVSGRRSQVMTERPGFGA